MYYLVRGARCGVSFGARCEVRGTIRRPSGPAHIDPKNKESFKLVNEIFLKFDLISSLLIVLK